MVEPIKLIDKQKESYKKIHELVKNYKLHPVNYCFIEAACQKYFTKFDKREHQLLDLMVLLRYVIAFGSDHPKIDQ